MEYLIFKEKPNDFNPTIFVSGCYCDYDDKILLLKRHPNKPQGNTWGVPAGKSEKDETPRMTVIREVKEEIGLDIDGDDLDYFGALYCRFPHFDFVYSMFRKRYPEQPEIELALDEHLEMKWVTLKEALAMPLIIGGAEALEVYQQLKDQRS